MTLGVDASRTPCLIPLAGGLEGERGAGISRNSREISKGQRDSHSGGGNDTSQAL